jgi:hypothetical protein
LRCSTPSRRLGKCKRYTPSSKLAEYRRAGNKAAVAFLERGLADYESGAPDATDKLRAGLLGGLAAEIAQYLGADTGACVAALDDGDTNRAKAALAQAGNDALVAGLRRRR